MNDDRDKSCAGDLEAARLGLVANFNAPKHGAVTHLTLDELKTLKSRWNVDLKLG